MRLGCWISKYLSYCWGFVSLGSMATVARETISPRAPGNTGVVYVTPHDMYSSSVGVLGCKINTILLESCSPGHRYSGDLTGIPTKFHYSSVLRESL